MQKIFRANIRTLYWFLPRNRRANTRGYLSSCLCFVSDQLDKLGLEPLLELLERAGLPRGIPTKKTAADFDLSRTIAKVHRTLGKPVLIDVLRESNETFTVRTN